MHVCVMCVCVRQNRQNGTGGMGVGGQTRIIKRERVPNAVPLPPFQLGGMAEQRLL